MTFSLARMAKFWILRIDSEDYRRLTLVTRKTDIDQVFLRKTDSGLKHSSQVIVSHDAIKHDRTHPVIMQKSMETEIR
jgi:hypothetical protein